MLRGVDHRDGLSELANDLGLLDQGAELGVYRGDFARVVLSRWHGSRWHLVDSWTNGQDLPYSHGQDENMDTAIASVDSFGAQRYKVVRNTTDLAAHTYAEGSLDWVYVDATHTYADCRRDLQTWAPKVRMGGLLSGHDYWNGWQPLASYTFGCRDAVDEFAAVYGLRVHSTKEDVASWYMLKC
jgi:hypothetical protein